MSRQWNLAFQIDHGYERLSEMSMVENKLFEDAKDIRRDNNPNQVFVTWLIILKANGKRN